MKSKDFTTSFTVAQSPMQAFNAINDVRGWWSQNIKGGTEKLGDEFDYHYEDMHRCKMKIIESVPGKRVVWHVLDNYFNFTKDSSEWKDTKIIFDITEKDGKTEVRFTHQGLVPAYECFEVCSDAWSSYIKGSLRDLVMEDKKIAPEDWKEINTRVTNEHLKN